MTVQAVVARFGLRVPSAGPFVPFTDAGLGRVVNGVYDGDGSASQDIILTDAQGQPLPTDGEYRPSAILFVARDTGDGQDFLLKLDSLAGDNVFYPPPNGAGLTPGCTILDNGFTVSVPLNQANPGTFPNYAFWAVLGGTPFTGTPLSP